VSVLNGDENTSLSNTGTLWTLLSVLTGLALAVLAVTVLILLVVAPARQYFTPGPGRRFLPGT
jgi:hypothetical protein